MSKVVHCPGGITEKDLKTFFDRVLDKNLHSELGEGLHLLDSHSCATWRDARLEIVGPWGGVCFVAGSGSNVFVVRAQRTPQHSLRSSLENLILGFFRLLVAMATLVTGTFHMLTLADISAFSLSELSEQEAYLKCLYILHHLLRVGVAIITAMDTVYGTQSLSKPGTGDDMERRKKLWENLGDVVERNTDGTNNTKQEGVFIVKQREDDSPRSRTSKLQTIDFLEDDSDDNEECRKRSVSRDAANMDRDTAYMDRISHGWKTKGRRCSRKGQVSSTLFSPGDKWLMRAGLYLALASSGRETELAQGTEFIHGGVAVGSSFIGQLKAHCIIRDIPAFSDCFLYTAGVLALLTAGVGFLCPGCLTTPWAHMMKVDGCAGSASRLEGKVYGIRLSHHGSRLRLWTTKGCQMLLRSFCLVTVVTLCVVHVLKLISKESTPCLTSPCSSCCQTINDSHNRTTSDSQCRVTFLQLRASCILTSLSPATLCACVSVWIVASLVLEVRGRQLNWVSSFSVVVLYLCCVSTMSSSLISEAAGCIVTEGNNQHTIYPPISFSVLERMLSWLEMDLVTLISSAMAVVVPLCFFLISQVLGMKQTCHQQGQTLKEMPKRDSIRHSNYYKRHFRVTVFKLLQATTTLISLCSLGLVLGAFALPWLTVTASTSGFHSLAGHLKNMSPKLEVSLDAAKSLLNYPICPENKMNVLSSQLGTSREVLATASVKDIANYCRSWVCQDKSQKHRSQSGDSVRFCAEFCSTLAYFQDKLDYNTSLHDSLAVTAKGDSTKEEILLKKVILKEKKKFMDVFPSTIKWADMTESLQSKKDASGQSADGTFKQQQMMNAYLRNSQKTNTCMQVLCVLRGLSISGMLVPLIGWMFQPLFMTVQALLAFANFAAKVEEILVIFIDFKARVEWLALYLEHSQQQKTVYFSITNYSLVHLAYPALTTGCIGILAGFWHRQEVSFNSRRRCTFAVVLPLLALNIFGAVIAVLWTQIVESLAGFIPPVQVTASLESGGRLLLAAFTCSGCSCLMFLALLHFEPPCSRQRVRDASRCTQESRAAHFRRSRHSECSRTRPRQPEKETSELGLAGATGECNSKSDATWGSQSPHPAGAHPGRTGGGSTPHPTPCQQHSAGCGDVETLSESWSSANTPTGGYCRGCCSLLHTAVSRAGCASACWPRSYVRRFPGLRGSAQNIKRKFSAKRAAKPERHPPAGCRPWLLAALLVSAGCGLMFTCIHVPVFSVHINLSRDFDVLLGRLEQSGSALEVSRLVLTREEPCDVMELIVREIVFHYLGTLKDIDVQPLTQAFREFGANVKNTVNTTLPLVTVPCLLTLVAASALVLYGAVGARFLRPQSRWILPPAAAASGTRRLALLSLGWLLHASLLLGGPAANAAAPDVIDIHVQLTSAFGAAVAAHVTVLFAAFELRLATVSPLM